MARLQLEGVFTAIVTPFSADGTTVDFEALGRLLDAQIAGGVAGIVPCGTTGETPTLSAAEKLEVISFCVKKAAGKMTVIAGTGSNNTAASVAATQAAKDVGADCCLIVNPYYNKPSQAGLVAHVQAINAVGLPIMLYNIPGRTACTMEPSTVAAIYKSCDQVCAVKEATGSLDMASEIRSLCDIAVLSGDDSLTLPLMSVGGKGVVSVLSNLAPEKVVGMVKTALGGDFAAAAAQHIELFPLFKAMFCETNPVPVKYAMHLAGMCEPSVRLPICALEPASRTIVEDMLVAKGIVTAESAKKKAKA